MTNRNARQASGVFCAAVLAALAGAASAADRLDLRELRVGTARVATWTSMGPDAAPSHAYSIRLADGRSTVVENADFRLNFLTGNFDPLADAPPAFPAQFAASNTGVYVVQFVTQALDEYRDAIGAAGGEILHYFPNYAYIVRMGEGARDAVAAMEFVRWVGDIQPAHKIDGDILIKRFGISFAPDAFRTRTANYMELQPDQFGREPYRVGLHKAGLDVALPIKNTIEAMGGSTCDVFGDQAFFNAHLTPEMILAVARLPMVSHITPGGEGGADMNNARILGGADYVAAQNGAGNPATGYNGEGVRAEAIDSGIQSNHVDFAGFINRNGAGTDSHGTAVFGINFGKGIGNPLAKGMNPAAQGIFSAVGAYLNGAVGCVVTPGVASRLGYTLPLVDPNQNFQAVYQQSSSGSERVFNYCPISQNMDNIIFSTDLVICQSQSNAGNQDSRPEAWAKNIVSGGGINHVNNTNWNDDSWTSASIGYSEDGRTKPDLSAFYDNVLTTTSGGATAYTASFSGTSSATPIVSGHFGIFHQMWHQGIFGNPTGATVFASRPHAMTAKAFMINTARQWTFNTWTTPAEPNLSRRRQGWGFPQLNNVYDLRNKCFVVDETQALQNLQTATYEVVVAAGEPALRVTMCYMDPPPTTIAPGQHRVNNLDLKVTDPNGDAVYWGNWGLTDQRVAPPTGVQNWAGGVNPPSEGMWSLPGGAANMKDTVENVFVQNPIAGRWTIQVIASEIVRDAVPHGFNTPPSGPVDANFGLVVTGAVRASCPGDTNGDNIINFADLNACLSNFGLMAGATTAQGDVDGDGDVDFADLNIILANFGNVC